MDKFSQDAFQKAEQQRLDAEANAWCNVDKGTMISVVLTSLITAGPDIVKLIDLVTKQGLVDALHEFEHRLLMGGFSLGYKAGQESMLNNE